MARPIPTDILASTRRFAEWLQLPDGPEKEALRPYMERVSARELRTLDEARIASERAFNRLLSFMALACLGILTMALLTQCSPARRRESEAVRLREARYWQSRPTTPPALLIPSLFNL